MVDGLAYDEVVTERAASQERPQPDTLDIPCRHEFPHDGPCEPGVAQERPSIDVLRDALQQSAERFHGLNDEPPHLSHIFRECPHAYCVEARAALAGGSVASPEPSDG
jgi:hypothetical protein